MTLQKIEAEIEGKNEYEFPEDDAKLVRKSNQYWLQNVLTCHNLPEQVRVITDLAFDAVDEDGSGGLDQEELYTIMGQVSIQMGVTPPTPDDLQEILMQLDDNFDGVIDKREFHSLTMMVLGNLLHSEYEL